MGRSRGGSTAKIHAAGLPVRCEPGPDRAHHSRAAATLLADSFLAADKACGAEWIRNPIEHPRPQRRERTRLQQAVSDRTRLLRCIAARYEKPAADFLATIEIATAGIRPGAYEAAT